jgi:hypothetical protein
MNILKLYFTNLYNIYFILMLFFTFYIFCSLWGYGNDNDTYALISSGKQLLNNFQYKPSRFQGNLIPEIVIGFTSKYGGFIFSNFISVLLGIFSLYILFKLLLFITTNSNSLFIITIIGLNPFFIIAATSTMDYIYAVFFLLFGFYLLITRKYLLSSIILSFALSSRLSNIFIILITYFFLFLNLTKKEKVKLFISGLFNLLITLLLYLPVYFYSSNSFSFLNYSIGNWNYIQYAIRFIYKNIAIFGLVIFLIIYYRLIILIYNSNFHFLKNSKVILFIFTINIIQELLFLKIPLEISYLLPNFIVLVILYSLLEKKITFKYCILFISFFNLFINIDFLKIKHDLGSTEAESASIGLYFKKGILIEDLINRSKSESYYQNTGIYK